MYSSSRRLSNPSRKGPHYELGGIWEQIYATHILSYLSAHDLCVLSSTCQFFFYTSQISHLWTNLIEENFSLPPENYKISDLVNRNDGSICNSVTNQTAVDGPKDCTGNCDPKSIHSLSFSSIEKKKYAERLQHKNDRYRQAREGAVQTKVESERDKKRRYIESFLDLTLFRILIPLPLTALFLSIILFTLHYDGVPISIWGCAAPLLFYFAYLLIFSLISFLVYKQRSNANSVLYHLWGNVHGPIKSFYQSNLNPSPMLTLCAVTVIFMCLIQIIFIAMKLSPVGMSGNILSTINWGVIFLPSWILFIICPFLGCGEVPIIMGLMVTIWIPLLIILICITVKLDRQENHGHGPDIRMAYIFIPFWIIEGSCMILSLIFFFCALHNYRIGLNSRLKEHFGTVIATFTLFGPFVIFQTFICVNDDHRFKSIRNSETVIPVLIIIGWFFVCAICHSLQSRTPFQELAYQNRRESAGTVTIFNV